MADNTVLPVGGGGDTGWSKGENASFNLQHSPAFEFSKPLKRKKRIPRTESPKIAPNAIEVRPNAVKIDDDELAIMLLSGSVNFASVPGIDDDDEAIWILLQ